MECTALTDMIDWFVELGEDLEAAACPDMTCEICFETASELRVAA